MWAFLNDGFVKDEDCVLHHNDLALQRGYGIFDFFKLVNNLPVFLDDHLERFYQSAATMHIPVNYSKDQLREIIFSLIQKNNKGNYGFRLDLTGGYSENGFPSSSPNFLITAQHFQPPTPAKYEEGIKLMSFEHQRQLPTVKTIDYLMSVWLQPQLKEKKADDILYHLKGRVSECPRSNIFLFTKNEKLITPADGILKGITRKKIIDLAKKHFDVEEKEIFMKDISDAKEIFISSTTKMILPVQQVDEVYFNNSHPVSKKLRNLLQNSYASFSASSTS